MELSRKRVGLRSKGSGLEVWGRLGTGSDLAAGIGIKKYEVGSMV